MRQPVRSGQVVYAEGTDLIVLAPVNPGAQLIADGNIHVYSTLRGRAVAGAKGAGQGAPRKLTQLHSTKAWTSAKASTRRACDCGFAHLEELVHAERVDSQAICALHIGQGGEGADRITIQRCRR